MRVPWMRIDADPGAFFSSTYLPPNIHLKDPSKMKEHDINECLELWLKVEREGERAFAFHHILKGKEMVTAENVENVDVKVDRKRKERKKERGVTENGRKTKGRKVAKKTKKEDRMRRDIEHETVNTEAEVSKMSEDDHRNSTCERDGKRGNNEDGKSTWEKDGTRGPEERRSGKHGHNKMNAGMIITPTSSGDKSHIPVDPILLQGFPTNGLNDLVPPGFTPVPFLLTVGILQEATSTDDQTLKVEDGKRQRRTWPSTMTPVQTWAKKQARETEDEYVHFGLPWLSLLTLRQRFQQTKKETQEMERGCNGKRCTKKRQRENEEGMIWLGCSVSSIIAFHLSYRIKRINWGR